MQNEHKICFCSLHNYTVIWSLPSFRQDFFLPVSMIMLTINLQTKWGLLQMFEHETVWTPKLENSLSLLICWMIIAHVVRMYRFWLVCVCLSGCQKLIISSLHHIFAFTWGGGLDPFRHVRLTMKFINSTNRKRQRFLWNSTISDDLSWC